MPKLLSISMIKWKLLFTVSKHFIITKFNIKFYSHHCCVLFACHSLANRSFNGHKIHWLRVLWIKDTFETFVSAFLNFSSFSMVFFLWGQMSSAYQGHFFCRIFRPKKLVPFSLNDGIFQKIWIIRTVPEKICSI